MPGMYPSLFTSKFDIKLSCLLCIGIGWNEHHATELTTQCFKGIRTATRICGGFLKWGIPSHHGFQWFQCSNGLILDDLGVPHDLGNLRTQWLIIISLFFMAIYGGIPHFQTSVRIRQVPSRAVEAMGVADVEYGHHGWISCSTYFEAIACAHIHRPWS